MNIKPFRTACYSVLVALAVTGCTQVSGAAPSPAPTSTSTTTTTSTLPVAVNPTQYLRSVLTQDGTDSLALSNTGRTVTMSAPVANKDNNTRQLFWRADTRTTVNESSCEILGNESAERTQPAVALRIATSGKGVRAITVTKNVWGNADYTINIYLWNTTAQGPLSDPDVGKEFVNAKSFTLSGLVAPPNTAAPNSNAKAFPWKMCAKVVGSRLTFRVWPLAERDPGWGNPNYGGTAVLPPGWVYPGQVGGYIAHLNPGDSATFTSPDL